MVKKNHCIICLKYLRIYTTTEIIDLLHCFLCEDLPTTFSALQGFVQHYSQLFLFSLLLLIWACQGLWFYHQLLSMHILEMCSSRIALGDCWWEEGSIKMRPGPTAPASLKDAIEFISFTNLVIVKFPHCNFVAILGSPRIRIRYIQPKSGSATSK